MRLDKDKMRSIRRSRGVSQAALGRRIGVSQGRIAMLEGGASIVPATAERVAAALMCDVGEIVQSDAPTVTLRLDRLSPEQIAVLTASR